jgi:hypothetical protein
MNKQRELRMVEALLNAIQGADVALEDGQREAPDALIRVNGRRIGVEVTDVVLASKPHSIPPQKWTAEAHRTVRVAQSIFEEQHLSALVVGVEFRHDWSADRRTARVVAADLSAIVSSCVESLDQEDITLRDPHRAISGLYVATTEPALGGHWAATLPFSGRPASAEDVWETVRRKERHVAAYRSVAPETWLAISCHTSGQGIALDVPSVDFTLKTGYDRVFCCGFALWPWVEIPCIPLDSTP